MNQATQDLLENINSMGSGGPITLYELKHLLDSGADPNVQARQSRNTFLQKLCTYELDIDDSTKTKYMDLFFDHPDINLNLLNREGLGLIHILSLQHTPYLLTYFLHKARNKYNVDLRLNKTEDTCYQRLTDGATSLFIACSHLAMGYNQRISADFNASKVNVLLRFGANPNAVDENGDNALIYLLHYGNYYYPTGQYLRNINVYKTVEKLLKCKIDPNTISNVDGGVSALIEAARFNADADVCSLLLNYGANPKQRMPDGSTLFDAKYPKSMHDGMGTVLTEWTRLKNINWNLTENKSENMMKTSKLHIKLPLEIRERIGSYIFKKQPPSQI